MADKMSRSARRNRKTPKKNPLWKKILLSLLFIGLALGITGGAVGAYWIITAPDLDPDMLDVPLSSTLYDQDGEPFATLETENRELIEYEELPQVLIDAVIATEDARFFEHNGIDLRRLGGAVLANITDGFGSQGASTITHQVVENFFLSNDKKISLKVQEQWLALQLERQYSKEEILEMYLNKIFYGNNSYGVAAAAKSYFGITDWDELTLPQAAILAGLPQRPTAYNPFRSPEITEHRMNTVLDLMVRHDKITEEEAEEARSTDIPSMLVESSNEDSTPYGAFVDIVADEISEKMEGTDIYTDGLKINTTIDTSVQDQVEFLLTDSEENPIDYGHEDVQGSIVVLDTETGAIQGVGGRRNSTASGDLNYATQPFQPGSTIKPILAYGPAIEYDQISTYHQLNDDAPYEVGGTPIRNFSREYSGWVTARYALSQSLNVPTVKLFEEVGSDRAVEFASNLGLEMPDSLDPRDSIGGGSLSVSPLELASAFRTFGNEGIYNEPYAVTSVEFPDGSTVDLRPESEAAIEDYTAYMLTDMLKDTITNGTWTAGDLGGLPVAGKTGTTNIGEAAGERWFTGYTTNYTITTLVGDYTDENGSRAGLPESVPSTVAQQMFRETLLPISEGKNTEDFTKPDSVVEVAIEQGTNPPELASDHTPESSRVTELFVRGTEPTTTSEKFDELDPVSGLNASYDEDSNSISVEWSYDSDADVSFEVSSSVDDGSMQALGTTEDSSFEISEAEEGSTHTIQVVVISNEGSLTSEAVTTTVTVGEDEEEEDIPPVSGLSATYHEAQGMIDVSWSYDGPSASFEVTVNGGQTQSVESQGIEITGDFTPGETYTISVTPIGGDGTEGNAESTSVTIPEAEEEPEEPDEPDESEETEEPEEPEEPDEYQEEPEEPVEEEEPQEEENEVDAEPEEELEEEEE